MSVTAAARHLADLMLSTYVVYHLFEAGKLRIDAFWLESCFDMDDHFADAFSAFPLLSHLLRALSSAGFNAFCTRRPAGV
jgi:hypothetical protein